MELFLSGVDLKRSLHTGKTERRDAFATDASSSRSNMEIYSAVREWEAPRQVIGVGHEAAGSVRASRAHPRILLSHLAWVNGESASWPGPEPKRDDS